VVSLAVAVAGGTRVGDIWDGLVVRAVSFPQLFTLPIDVNLLVVLGAVISLVASVDSLRARISRSTADVARLVAGLFILLSVLLLPTPTWLLGLALAWVVTRPPVGTPAQYVRFLLPALAAMEGLQAYPVAGTQLSLAALLVILVGAVVLNDGVTALKASWAPRVGPVALIFAAAVLVLEGFVAGSQFISNTPSGLRGAESVRMPAQQATQLRQLVAAIDSGCSSFVTFPGMNSLYIWTGQESPSDLRYGVWWLIPDAADQQAIVKKLEGQPRLCVVKNQTLIDFWAQGRPVPSQPVVDFIVSSFVPDATFGDYELLVRKTQ